MKTQQKNFVDLLAVVIPRNNGTKAGIAALAASLEMGCK